MKRWRDDIILFSILGIFIVGLALIMYFKDGEYSIATLRSETSYVFDIRTPYFSEMTQLVYCRIRKGRKTIFYRMIGTAGVATNKLRFILVENDGGLVAITEQINPHNIIVIFDLNKHIGFPSDLTYQEEKRIGKQLVQQLNATIQGEPFVLGGGVLGWPIQENNKNTNTSEEVDE